MSNTIKCLLVSALCILISGCGFLPRRASDLPAPLHTLNVLSDTPNNALTIQITRLLKSLSVTLTNKPTFNGYTLNIRNIQFTSNKPSITTSNQAVNLTYSLSMTYSLTHTRCQPILPSQTLRVNHTLMLNANQIYTSNASQWLKQTMIQNLTTLLYAHLTSQDTKKAVNACRSAIHNSRTH